MERKEASSRKKRSLDFQDIFGSSCEDLKGMEQLSAIDDAFQIDKDYYIFESQTKPPTLDEFMEWDVYAIIHYLLQHSSCGNKPRPFYASSSQQEEQLKHTQPLTEEILSEDEFKDMFESSCEDLKGMEPLSAIDDAFHLSWDTINKVLCIFELQRKAPTLDEFMEWDVYAKIHYLKLHSSCGNKPPPFYPSSSSQQEEQLKHTQPLTEEILSEDEHMESPQRPLTEDILSEEELQHMESPLTENILSEEEHMESPQPLSYESLLEEDDGDDGFCWLVLRGPFSFGFYTQDTSPDRIPYHLYLLVKKAADIMKSSCSEWHSNTNDVTELTLVEEKIWFFCNYFNSHLPTGWKYERNNASKEVASYDTTRQPKYNMAGYTPPTFTFTGRLVAYEYDEKTNLERQEMLAIMRLIHSRKTPIIWKMCPSQISFYCKICSCFGIDYHRLEDASEDDVCLMNV